jgi:exodeoxyribonuclease VII large subunit
MIADIQLQSRRSVHLARVRIEQDFARVSSLARSSAAEASSRLPDLRTQVILGIRHVVSSVNNTIERDKAEFKDLAYRSLMISRRDANRLLQSITHDAPRIVAETSGEVENLMREVVNQGPDRTLRRGFAIIRDQLGDPIQTAAEARNQEVVEIQFFDNSITARLQKDE